MLHRFVACLLIALPLVGCSVPKLNTTRLDSIDLVTMTDQMAASLTSSEAITGSDRSSKPWTVTMDRVSNQTNDIMPEGEKRAFLARLRAQLNQSPALASRNITFVAPLAQRQATEELQVAPTAIRPTHALTATFYAASERTRAARSDAYLAAFQLLDLKTNQIVWEDRYEVKYAVQRNKLD